MSRKAPKLAWWIATGFGSGRLKPAPGTWGSLACLIVWTGLVLAGLRPWAAWALTPLLALLAVWSSHRVVDETGLKDPGYIVIDEWAGLWIALLPTAGFLARHGFGRPWLAALAASFLLFRLFDIWKPWPVHQLQSLPRGWGVVVDDLMAGVYAALLTALALPLLR